MADSVFDGTASKTIAPQNFNNAIFLCAVKALISVASCFIYNTSFAFRLADVGIIVTVGILVQQKILLKNFNAASAILWANQLIIANLFYLLGHLLVYGVFYFRILQFDKDTYHLLYAGTSVIADMYFIIAIIGMGNGLRMIQGDNIGLNQLGTLYFCIYLPCEILDLLFCTKNGRQYYDNIRHFYRPMVHILFTIVSVYTLLIFYKASQYSKRGIPATGNE